jgi:hypothetical protein
MQTCVGVECAPPFPWGGLLLDLADDILLRVPLLHRTQLAVLSKHFASAHRQGQQDVAGCGSIFPWEDLPLELKGDILARVPLLRLA